MIYSLSFTEPSYLLLSPCQTEPYYRIRPTLQNFANDSSLSASEGGSNSNCWLQMRYHACPKVWYHPVVLVNRHCYFIIVLMIKSTSRYVETEYRPRHLSWVVFFSVPSLNIIITGHYRFFTHSFQHILRCCSTIWRYLGCTIYRNVNHR